MIKMNDIHYIAGLLEGEGCFGFYNCPVIQVHMTDAEPVRKLRSLMAPHARIRIQNNKRGGRKTQYILHFSGQLAIERMMTLYPLMSPRRQEAIKNVIREWKSVTGRFHTLSITNRKRYA